MPYNNGIGSIVENYTHIRRSADSTRLYLLGSTNDSLFTYDAVNNRFSPYTDCGYLDYIKAAVNRDGTLLASVFRTPNTGRVSLDGGADLSFKHSWTGPDGGVAFDATKDILYAVNTSSDEIVAYDTNNYREQFRFPIGEDIVTDRGFSFDYNTGSMIASNDGRYLALQTDTGIKILSVPQTPPPPSPTPTPTLSDIRRMVFNHAGDYL